MGAYTSCTIYCDDITRRPNGTDGPYKYPCDNETPWPSIRHCMSKMTTFCNGGLEVNNDPSEVGRYSVNEAELTCPSRGLTERQFAGIIYAVLVITLILMGVCQYTAVWAFIKQKRIHGMLAALSSGFSFHIRTPRMLQAPSEGSSSVEDESQKQREIVGFQGNAFTADRITNGNLQLQVSQNEFFNDATMYAKPVGAVTTPSVQQVQMVVFGFRDQQVPPARYHGGAGAGRGGGDDPSTTRSMLTMEEEKMKLDEILLEEGPLPGLKTLERTSWMACWCQMSALITWCLLVCFMLFVLAYYKPKVERDAKVSDEEAPHKEPHYHSVHGLLP